jgi:hypothetical protein
MSKNRGGSSVVQSELSLKAWQEHPPTVAEARLSKCPMCGAPSCPVGEPIQLHGHGVRARLVFGPGGPTEAATITTIMARRYRCVPCTAVIVVVPREVRGRRQYSASAIALALALWGLLLATAAEVRRRVSAAKVVGATAARGWATLRRWARAAEQKKLFPSVPLPGGEATLRQVAAAVATALSASADPATRGHPVEQRAFVGGGQAA